MTFIVPIGGLKEVSLRDSGFTYPCWLLEWCKRCFNFPSWTSWSKWFLKFLQSSVVCPGSWWYWQYRFWLRLMGSPAILFGHLKNDLFLIFSRTWCTGSRNTALIACASADPDCPAKSLLGRLLLLNRFDLKSLLSWGQSLLYLYLIAGLLQPFYTCRSGPWVGQAGDRFSC